MAAAFQKCRSIRGGEESDFKVVFKKAISTVNFFNSRLLKHPGPYLSNQSMKYMFTITEIFKKKGKKGVVLRFFCSHGFALDGTAVL